MKRKTLFLILILLLFVPATSSLLYAQRDPITDIIVPPPPDNDDDRCPSGAEPGRNGECPDDSDSSDNDDPSHNDDPNPDSDGDGLSDVDDKCPAQGGPTWNAGCPEDQRDPNDVPTSVPDPNDPPPPFRPPALPDDACYVTPSVNNNVNARKSPNLGADIIGFLSPGVVYEAQGVVTGGTESWYGLVTYEGSTGTVAYVARLVVIATSDCPPIQVPGGGTAPDPVDDYTDVPIALCDMSVGWDAPTWSTSEPQGESVVNMALWFAYEPGTEIPAGTDAVGVIYLRGGVDLPDAENIVAVMTDPMILDAALNSDNPVEYGYPTAANGVQSGDTTFYRLTNDIGQVGDGTGNCGPIVGNIDSFSDAPSTDAQPISIPINEYACTVTTSYDFIFAFNTAPGEAIPVDTNPIAIINANYASGAPASWYATLEEVDGETLQYMVAPFWASLVRTGGNCGPIGTARR